MPIIRAERSRYMPVPDSAVPTIMGQGDSPGRREERRAAAIKRLEAQMHDPELYLTQKRDILSRALRALKSGADHG